MILMERIRSADENSTSSWRHETRRSPGGGKLVALPISKRTGSGHVPVSPRNPLDVVPDDLNLPVDTKDDKHFNNFVIEAPSWAVAAKGEARLEPVCEAYGTHPPVDLTKKSFYVIGRSPTSHVPLVHRTSSRLHAYFFHHPSGAAFVMDCKSAHGTYVNGQLIESGLPFRVKRGSLIRFGSVGAPCFVLKSFSVEFDRMVNDLDDVADVLKSSSNNKNRVEGFAFMKEIDSHGVACVKNSDGTGMACITDVGDASNAALVLMNTRVNACGGIKALSRSHQKLSNIATMKFSNNCANAKKDNFSVPGRKRHFNDVNTTTSIPINSNPVSIAPLFKRKVRRRVSFDSQEPQLFFPALVTPQDLSSDDESTNSTQS